MTTTTAALIDPCPLGYPLPADVPPDLPTGRHCGRGNIIRHYVLEPEDVDLKGSVGNKFRAVARLPFPTE